MALEGFDLGGKVALVVGCGEVGRAVALALAEAGADVAVVAATQEGAEAMAAKRAARRVGEMGRRSLAQAIDATNGTAVQVMVRQVAKELGGLDILVNCPDLHLVNPLERVSDAEWLRVLNLNLSSAFYACRAAVREMERRGRGKIVNVASALGERGVSHGSAYSAAKGGVIALTRALAEELGPRGIWVNCVAPGWLDDSPGVGPEDAQANPLVRYIPLQRFGRPEDVAAAVIYLAAPASDYVGGQVIYVDGGAHAFNRNALVRRLGEI